MPPVCDNELLLYASDMAYVLDQTVVDHGLVGYKTYLDILTSKGYTIDEKMFPKHVGGSGDTNLGAVCLKPNDERSPIIIAFRGTKYLGDVSDDAYLSMYGVAKEGTRKAARAFYDEIRKANPGREIILTGHSLGGHIAEDLGSCIHSMAIDAEENDTPKVQVVTYNAPGTSSPEQANVRTHPNIARRFRSYRTSGDVVSGMFEERSVGNIYTHDQRLSPVTIKDTSIYDIPPLLGSLYLGLSSEHLNVTLQVAKITCRAICYNLVELASSHSIETLLETLPDEVLMHRFDHHDHDQSVELNSFREQLTNIAGISRIKKKETLSMRSSTNEDKIKCVLFDNNISLVIQLLKVGKYDEVDELLKLMASKTTGDKDFDKYASQLALSFGNYSPLLFAEGRG